MLDTFLAGKDLYAEIASASFGYSYIDCLEFPPKGTPIKHDSNGNWMICNESEAEKFADGENDTNHDGKERRSQAKKILLGILYGRGIESVAEQLNCTSDKAQEIKDAVFKGFPAIKSFEERSLQMAHSLGYVTTVCGRKRRLPNINLPQYSFTYTDAYKKATGLSVVPLETCEYLTTQLNNIYGRKNQNEFINSALSDGIIIKCNQKLIADATRQCVNARIQGRRNNKLPLSI